MQSHSTQIKTEEFFQQSDSLFTGNNVDLFVSASLPSTSSNCLLGDEVDLFVSASTPSGAQIAKPATVSSCLFPPLRPKPA